MTIIVLIFLIIAAVLFALASVNTVSPKINLVAAGLLSWVLAVIIGGVQLGIK